MKESNIDDLRLIQALIKRNKKLKMQSDLLSTTLLEIFNFQRKKMDEMEKNLRRYARINNERI